VKTLREADPTPVAVAEKNHGIRDLTIYAKAGQGEHQNQRSRRGTSNAGHDHYLPTKS
jgi:hypothetical protein